MIPEPWVRAPPAPHVAVNPQERHRESTESRRAGRGRPGGLARLVRDSCNNARIDAFHSSVEARSVRRQGSREDVGDLEVAVAEYIDWLDQRVDAGIGLIPLPS